MLVKAEDWQKYVKPMKLMKTDKKYRNYTNISRRMINGQTKIQL
jgi:hypothetical protein